MILFGFCYYRGRRQKVGNKKKVIPDIQKFAHPKLAKTNVSINIFVLQYPNQNNYLSKNLFSYYFHKTFIGTFSVEY